MASSSRAVEAMTVTKLNQSGHDTEVDGQRDEQEVDGEGMNYREVRETKEIRCLCLVCLVSYIKIILFLYGKQLKEQPDVYELEHI